MIPEHDDRDYWRFTLKGMKILAEKNGFRVVYEKRLTNNMHSIGHMLGNAIWLSLVGKGKSRYITGLLALPVVLFVRLILAFFSKMSSLSTGYMTCIIVCKPKKDSINL